MDLLQLVTLLSLLLLVVTIYKVGKARVKFGVKAPATTGNADFERYYRVQMNTLEHMVIFLPAMWSFAYTWAAPQLASALGALWIAGRIIYAAGYYKAADKRGAGFMIAMLSTAILLLGAIIGVTKHLLEM